MAMKHPKVAKYVILFCVISSYIQVPTASQWRSVDMNGLNRVIAKLPLKIK